MADQMAQLIRLRTWELDEKRRVLAEFLSQADALKDERAALEDEVVAEQRSAAGSQIGAFGYGAYAQEVIRRRERLDRAIADAEAKVLEANEEVAECFQELKKVEKTKEMRDEREAARLARIEQTELDEIARSIYVRKEK